MPLFAGMKTVGIDVSLTGMPWEIPSYRMFIMLALRPNCECCDRDLPPDSRDARICSFECTFCAGCADGVLGGRCPNCGGELVRRPIRAPDRLARFPAATARTLRPGGCPAA
jgi:uncharacterized protein